MVLFEFPPSRQLADYVRTYRIVHFQFDHSQPSFCKPYPPKPEQCLTFYPRDCERVEYMGSNKQAGNLRAVLFGQQTEVTNRYVGKDFLLFQIVFNPGAVYRITGVPSHEITNAYLDAETFFNRDIKAVNNRLNDCNNYRDMIPVIESFLLQQIRLKSYDAHRVDIIGDMMIKDSENRTVDWLARTACLSARQLERVFSERMGVSPKYFTKVARFENAFRMKNKYPNMDWLTIALHCGYYDYQHLVKDYKSLTLKTPTAFHLLDLSAPERFFGEADTY
ncbi:helix-turn-helix protein [Chitinophaga dinghuensis]|uniref:Helix-turn-helix protein n=1 Tax=Chitinophaga dinghuensis TaxID=1539050 RepID=A0A327VYP5_9BACT|nr:helix-turn-helix domain-containing protein [Chitinophaga dinghuensis]RAJ80066.1 helix-turn-helix protein [Chitinophaga dinghuensis]